MPAFDLRGIKIAEYNNNNGTVSYTNAQTVGDAMNVNISVRRAEGRLYAESTLAEYMTKVTGGAISLGVKYIPEAAQKVLFGTKENTRTLSGGQVKSLLHSAKDQGKYVGCAFYVPDMIDGVEKFTCMMVKKARFGQPDYQFATAGESITFNTPTTTGEFLADDTPEQDMIEVAVVDTEALAIAWRDAVLS